MKQADVLRMLKLIALLLLLLVRTIAHGQLELKRQSVGSKHLTTVNDVTDSLVFWLKFDEGTGTTANDSGTLNNDGTLVGAPTWETGKVGPYCLHFTNFYNTNYVEIANPGTILNGSNVTGIAWVKWETAENSYARVIDRDYAGQFAFYVHHTGGNEISAALVPTGGAFDIGTDSTTPISLNTWTHIAWVWDGSGISFYTNGVFAETRTTTLGALVSSTSLIRIAQRADAGGNRGFTGWLDDVRLYHRNLSATEVSRVYDATK